MWTNLKSSHPLWPLQKYYQNHLTLAKTVPKSYLTVTLGLYQSYISHICTQFGLFLTNIWPIYYQNQVHILVIWIWEKNWYLMAPPLRPNLGKNWNVDYFEIFAPPRTLAKTLPKPSDPCKNSTSISSNCYIGTLSIIYQPYMYQILPMEFDNSWVI